jgi:hypothetical protein
MQSQNQRNGQRLLVKSQGTPAAHQKECNDKLIIITTTEKRTLKDRWTVLAKLKLGPTNRSINQLVDHQSVDS